MTSNPATPYRAWSAWIPLLMSGTALSLLLVYLATGPHAPYMVVENGVPRPDESATARLWQLLMVLQLPVMGWFAFRWLPRHPRRAVAILAMQALAIVVAAVPVYLLEH
ncbi:hypothetical protein GRI89_17635 [Altererythrobacter salegens]|uniref:Uncharacterized protein n=1 Tax=Croceibacterium salegens TaxID=1737568 RepID=A0A6I4T2A4_9SPHN|nr:hypothetical protein [Croceibacterium salegens]MXO61367.1 hypothetical protein [Croceibacterium salegens]